MRTLESFQQPATIYTAKPAGETPADWIKARAMPLFIACSYDGVGQCIMSVLRAMEIWAKDNGKHVDDVVIADMSFVHGDLVVTFK